MTVTRRAFTFTAAALFPLSANPNLIVIPPAGEPGDWMILSGTVFAPDGRTPVPGARLYVYHTDATGHYTPPGATSRLARLRAWLTTGADGSYAFKTIRPAAYPNRSVPAHIHVHLQTRDLPEYFLNDDFWFAGDPLLTPEQLAAQRARGSFSAVVQLERAPDGLLHGRRDLRIDPQEALRNRCTPEILRQLGR